MPTCTSREGNEMGSSGKKRTTMAKLNREGKLREKRVEKESRKTARKLSAARDAADTASAGLDGDGSEGAESESFVAVQDRASG
jgi:hypothetical protein